MSHEPEITRVVRSWLEEGVDRLPDRVFDSVLEQLPTTPQRRHMWSAWRLRSMTNIVRVAVVAGVVVVAAVAGFRLLPGGGVGGLAPAPTAAPTPSPTPSPSAVAIGTGDLKRSLVAGTYRVASPFGVPFTVSFPGAWTPNALVAGDVNMATSGSSIAIDLVDNVFADPCHSGGGPMNPPVAATVDGVTQALTHMVGFNAGPVSDAVVGGHAGKTFLLSNTINTATAKCAGGAMLPIWTFRGDKNGAATNGGTQAQIWVIDVNGTPVAIWGDGDRSSFERVVQSIVFDN